MAMSSPAAPSFSASSALSIALGQECNWKEVSLLVDFVLDGVLPPQRHEVIEEHWSWEPTHRAGRKLAEAPAPAVITARQKKEKAAAAAAAAAGAATDKRGRKARGAEDEFYVFEDDLLDEDAEDEAAEAAEAEGQRAAGHKTRSWVRPEGRAPSCSVP